MNEHVGVTLDVLPGTLGGITAALGGFNELVGATSMLTSAIAKSTSAVDAMMLTLGVGIVGLGYESAKAFGEVERSMKIVQSVSGQTATEIGVLTQAANDLSVRYKMGIDEITDGLTTLGRAGLSSVNTQLDTMKAGLEAAKVTGLQLDDVLNKIVQTTALLGGDINSSSFGYQSQDLTSKILATSQTAPIDMNDVVQTLSYSGGTAAAGGINIQNEDALYDYLGTIAAFGQKGVSGSMAGTALRAFFTKPASQTSQVNDALGRLGMKPEDLWEDGGNKIRPVSEQIDLIQKQMDKLKISQIDQIELWGKIVSPKMGQQMLKLDADSIRDLTEKIKQTDTAEQLAENTMRNFMSDLSTLEQQGQREWREYGQAAVTWIGPVVKGISGLMNILGQDIGGFPIFQQFVKGAIILVISKVIQSLGSVWQLMKGIGSEIRSQMQGFSQLKLTEEQREANLKREYQTMGLTEKQVKTFVAETQKMHSGFGTSNKILGEFLGKLNEAVALMARLSQLSQINSMKMIGNMTGSQYQNFYDKNKTLPKGAWYDNAYNRGDLTKTDFAKLSLRHGMDQNTLKNIYYGTDKTHGQSFYNYALKNQTGFADSIQKGKSTFITATTLEKYLQEKNMGMYDPKTNPIMGIVQQIKGDTGVIAGKSKTGAGPSQTGSKQDKAAEKTINEQAKNAERGKQVVAEKNVTNQTEETVQLKQKGNQNEQEKNKITGLDVIAARNKLEQSKKQENLINQEIAENNTAIAVQKEKNATIEANTAALQRQLRSAMSSSANEASLNRRIELNKQEIAGNEQEINRLENENANNANRIHALQAERLRLIALIIQGESVQASAQTNAASAFSTQSGIQVTRNNTSAAILEEEIEQLNLERLSAEQLLLINSILKTLPNTLRERQLIEQKLASLEIEEETIQGQINGMDRAILRNKMRQAQGQGALYTPVGLGNVAQPTATLNGATMTRFSIPLGTTPSATQVSQGNGFGAMFQRSMMAGFSGSRNYREGTGLRNMAGNWFYNAGMMQMVDRGAIEKATANMGKFGKIAGVAGGALGSLSMMFGPVEIALMGLSLVMQGLQTAYQNYQKELEEINSQLSEAREKIKEAEEAFTSAYDEANPKATQDEKDEALLDAYAGDTSASKDDGLQTYRDKLFANVAQIEVNTRKKSDQELHPIWGESGEWEKQKDKSLESSSEYLPMAANATNPLGIIASIMTKAVNDVFDINTFIRSTFNPNDSDNVIKDYTEQLKVQAANAKTLGNSESQINTSEYIVSELSKSYDISSDKLNQTLNKYPDWIARHDKSENAKYARSIMAEGIDYMGPTQGRAYEGIWGAGSSGKDLAQFYKMQSEAMQLSDNDKNILENAINDNEDFLKKMQKMFFKESKDGRLVGRDEKTETKILRAIQNRLGGISRAQAKIALTLAAVSEIQKVVSEQVQPTLMSHMEAAWEGVSISSGTQDQVGGTWSTTSAVQQGVSIISAQMARLLQQKAFELGSMKAEMAGIDMKDLDALRLAAKEDPNRTSITINGHTYDKDAISDAVNIFSGMETAPYEAIALQRGETPDKAREWALDMKKKLDENGARASAVWETQAKGLQYYLDPIITDAYLNSMKDSDAKATGAADSGKDKSKDKDTSKDTSNRKNWVNLAICNKKEIPKLNVNLFKKPPNFTILNRNFKLRDVNVNTADDAKSIQNAVKNSIIEIQNRSNPKIIQDDAAEYDPVNATEGGKDIPTGTKKTE